MVCLSDAKLEKFPTGTIWALVGSLAYALYLVTLKRKVKDDQQLDIPMFFGKSDTSLLTSCSTDIGTLQGDTGKVSYQGKVTVCAPLF